MLKALQENDADILQELPELYQADVLSQLGTKRADDVLETMDPDDASDLPSALRLTDTEFLLTRMDPEDSGMVRRLRYPPDTARDLMTSQPLIRWCWHRMQRSLRHWPGSTIPTSPPRCRQWYSWARPRPAGTTS